ncbi:SOS response-associated peptidase [Paenibacillus yanchengensis]|uniref:Abasic site processing protein n=1 Tax=Paenibacillus yanchengensis TaxID=2035833 RepID=A0ABW4YGF7_9BACL
MIDRFSLSTEPVHIAEQFQVIKTLKTAEQRYNISPTQQTVIVMNDRHQVRSLQRARWGLYPFWARDAVNTAHNEVGHKKFLGDMIRRQRCIIPSTGFYGKKQIGVEKDPRFMHVVVKNRPLFGIAGMYDCWRTPSGEEAIAFTMLTADLSGPMSTWQSKVPIILDEEGMEQWLNPELREWNPLRKHIVPLDSYVMHAYPVTNAVHNEQYESPDCIREIDYA